MRAAAALLFLLLAACGNESLAPLVATNIEITAAVPGSNMSAAYLSLTNNSSDSIAVTRVTSPNFGAVEIHTSSIDNGISKMRRADQLIIAAGSTTTLQRGGIHLMLMRPTGNSAHASLSFYDHETLLLTVDAAITPRNN
jgi:copper(I)-binding protein